MASSSSASLLVVDDMADNRDLLARRLERRGYTVRVAEDGLNALRAIEAEPPDAVLLDLHMPGMDGLDVLRQIREVHGKIEMPVLMVTAETDSAVVVQALQLGANDYVTKPITFKIMLARLESQLGLKAEAPKSLEVVLRSDELGDGDMIDGRYRVESLLGEGGFAVVYKAKQVSTGRDVAVKLLQTHRLRADDTGIAFARFEQEMRLIGSIRHPNIVRLLDSGRIRFTRRQPLSEPEGLVTRQSFAKRRSPPADNSDANSAPYLVMEYLEGQTLAARIDEAGKLGIEQTMRNILPVISGVAAAHAEGIVHRDLKPANIFLARGRNAVTPCVLDFGVAKMVGPGSDEITVESAAVIGTPEYMSPEQAKGIKNITPASDQYTLAVVAYECITGRRPYRANSMVQLLHMICTAEYTLPREHDETIPEQLEQVLIKAMAAEPGERYASVSELGRALLPFASEATRAEWSAIFGG